MPHASTENVLWLFDLTVRATLILALAGIIAALLARASAVLRHLVWTCAVVALLALPLLMVAMPAWTALPHWTSASVGQAPASDANRALAITNRAVLRVPVHESPSTAAVSVPLTTPISAPATTSALTWPFWIVTLWLAGSAACISPLIVAWVALLRLRTRARPCTAPQAHTMLAQCQSEVFAVGHVQLLEAAGAAPMTFGIFRPKILVPNESAAWPAERWRIVLRHELAHIQRRDLLTQTLALIMRALYWFHPLAWLACNRMAAERERACDDLALLAGTAPAEYAEELFAIARTARRARIARGAAAAMLPMARFSSIESRVRAVLDVRLRRRRVSAAIVVAVFAAATTVVLPVACLRAASATSPSARPAGSNTSPAATAGNRMGGEKPVVAVLGQVERPGYYPVEQGIASNVGELLASAGSSKANPETLVSLHVTNAQGTPETVWEKTYAAAQNIALHDRDLIYVGHLSSSSAPAGTKPTTAGTSQPTTSAGAVDPAVIAIFEAEVEIARHHAESTAMVDAQQAILDDATTKLARLQNLQNNAVIAKSTLDDAQLRVVVETAKLQIAKSEHEDDVLHYKQALARLQAVKNGVSLLALDPAAQSSAPGRTAGENDAALALAKHKADDSTAVDAERAIVAQYEKNVDHLKAAHDSGIVPQGELDAATAELTRARSQLAIELSRREEEVLKYKLLQQQTQAVHSMQPASAPGSSLEIIPAEVKPDPNQPNEFYIKGAVARPGVYSLDERTFTIKGALTAAGVDQNNLQDFIVTLNRRTAENTETIVNNIRPAAVFAGTEPDRYLQANDILEIHSTAATQSSATSPTTRP